jgi:trigger factor
MTFEFDLEVRPEFDLPRWKGLCIEKPVRAITSTDVNRCLQKILADRGRLVPHDGPAELGDYLNVNLRVEHAGRTLAIAREELIRLRPTLSFRDGKLEGFNRLMAGVRAGETRQTEVTVTLDAPNVALRGQVVTVIFEVLEVKKVELADLTPELLRELGNFNSEAELRDVLVDALEEQLRYEQRRRARRQITATLTDAADWELPPALLERQSRRELERAVMELERSGFSPEEIRAHMNVLRQNSRAATAQALKEHFILEKIAEEEKIDASEEDYEEEIAALAQQTGQTPRRIRARLEKTNSFDVLRNQIIERKVIDRILEHAEFVEVPYEFPELDVEAIDRALGGEQAEIPAAKPGGGEAAAGGHPQPQRIRG